MLHFLIEEKHLVMGTSAREAGDGTSALGIACEKITKKSDGDDFSCYFFFPIFFQVILPLPIRCSGDPRGSVPRWVMFSLRKTPCLTSSTSWTTEASCISCISGWTASSFIASAQPQPHAMTNFPRIKLHSMDYPTCIRNFRRQVSEGDENNLIFKSNFYNQSINESSDKPRQNIHSFHRTSWSLTFVACFWKSPRKSIHFVMNYVLKK